MLYTRKPVDNRKRHVGQRHNVFSAVLGASARNGDGASFYVDLRPLQTADLAATATSQEDQLHKAPVAIIGQSIPHRSCFFIGERAFAGVVFLLLVGTGDRVIVFLFALAYRPAKHGS